MTAEKLAEMYLRGGLKFFQSPHLINLFGIPEEKMIGCLWFEDNEPKIDIFKSTIQPRFDKQRNFVVCSYKGKTSILVDSQDRNLIIKPVAIWSFAAKTTKSQKNEITIDKIEDWKRFWFRIMDQVKHFPGYPFTYTEFKLNT